MQYDLFAPLLDFVADRFGVPKTAQPTLPKPTLTSNSPHLPADLLAHHADATPDISINHPKNLQDQARPAALSQTLIELPSSGELPRVLAQYPHGIRLGNYFVPYRLTRSKRRTIGFLINEAGLKMTAPQWVKSADIHAAIISKERWIIDKLLEFQQRTPTTLTPPTVWQTGATLPYLGNTATLQIAYGRASFYDENNQRITINLPADASSALCKKHLQAWLMKEARRVFSERLIHYAKELGVTYHSFSLSAANTRWGSCNSQGKIRLNWRLIHFAPHLIDYVIAHELAHLIEMNHSARFWANVGKIYPNYVAAREELKQSGMRALPQF